MVTLRSVCRPVNAFEGVWLPGGEWLPKPFVVVVMWPNYIFFFGVAGVGKTYSGQVLSRLLGYESYDLDQDMTEAMRKAIAEGRPFTDEIRDEFFEVVSSRIAEIKTTTPRCIFMQGAYKLTHRNRLKALHPNVVFVMIDAPEPLVMQRLLGRGSRISREYAATLKQSFEPASSGERVLLNDECLPEALADRFRMLFD